VGGGFLSGDELFPQNGGGGVLRGRRNFWGRILFFSRGFLLGGVLYLSWRGVRGKVLFLSANFSLLGLLGGLVGYSVEGGSMGG